jgi:DNA-binding NarL/FixJ family response regulator
MVKKSIFICSNQCLFSQGIKTMLDERPGLVVTGWECDPDLAVRRIIETRPDAVLIISTRENGLPRLDGQSLLREGVKAIIFELNLQDNRVCVYRGEMRKVDEVKDLEQVLESFLASRFLGMDQNREAIEPPGE